MTGPLVLFAVVCLAPSALFWCALRVPALYRWVARRRPGRPVPAGPPIEQLSADLRRVRRQLSGYPPGTPAARRYGTRQAYDELLATACREVGVDHRLAVLPEGIDRDLERLRVEDSLRQHGLVVS
ncbi:hypothetical protein [Amycolatopsis saalfeldensis]|uniref:Uncharacterized protein n=1 Tax=Amycolatopsis saalfeldensis TaxID=394193 RepID=A0A1H8X7E5_9PSEU|nr:hypothetical protein [Amycolatopsis saalfeldensis]SEP35850.1 hypothetical protein SAMN04489732_106390 [Amycolatopsis saalfeldensis]